MSKREISSCIHRASQNSRLVLFFSSQRSRSSGTRRTRCQISTPGLSLFLNTGIRTRGKAQAHLMRSAAETTLFARISVTVCAVGVAFLSLCPEFNLFCCTFVNRACRTLKTARSISDLRSSDEIIIKSGFEMKVATAELLLMSSEMLTG